jgi:hypothetical protein
MGGMRELVAAVYNAVMRSYTPVWRDRTRATFQENEEGMRQTLRAAAIQLDELKVQNSMSGCSGARITNAPYQIIHLSAATRNA